MSKHLSTLLKPFKEQFQPNQTKIDKALSDIEYVYKYGKEHKQTNNYQILHLAFKDCLNLTSQGYKLVEYGSSPRTNGGCVVEFIKPIELQELEIRQKQDKWLNEYHLSLEEIKNKIIEDLAHEKIIQQEVDSKIKLQVDNDLLKSKLNDLLSQA